MSNFRFTASGFRFTSNVLMLQISFVVLTRNDEERLKRCLLSIKKFADEIIIVDEFSTDKTSEIANKFEGKVIKNKNSENFAEARNLGMKSARNEWIFFIDSDEELVQISNFKFQILNSEIAAYKIKRRDYMWGKEIKHGENGNWCEARVVNKNAGKWVGRVHERFELINTGTTCCAPTTQIYLKHYPHQTVREFLDEINRYSDLRAKELFESGVKSGILRICFYPLGKFIVDYFWFLGFLDGVPGFIIASMMSFYSFLVRAKLYMIREKNSHPEGMK